MVWFIIVLCLAVVIGGCHAWRLSDQRAEHQARKALIQTAVDGGQVFDPSMVASLPEPAQRYFRFTIKPGTPLRTVADIWMSGQIGMGTRQSPNYRPMQARQILVPPFGLVWQMKAGLISGSDAITAQTSWTRFWLLGLIPVVRAGGSDHHRSAFGRVVAESAIWVPASLLPAPQVRWETLDADSARAIITFGGFEQSVDITVDAAGAPTQVLINRWSNANEKGVFREQPFGGYLSDHRDFDGYTLPTRVEGGNLIGTEDYFPFFKAEVSQIRMLARPSSGAA